MKEVQALESEAGFKVLFECATLGIVVVGESGNIELANPCAEKLFGYGAAELIGKPLETLIPQNLREKHTHFRNGYFEGPKSRPMGVGMELFAQRKDSHLFPVEISLGHYQIENENLAVAFVSDISIRKANQEKYQNLFENSLAAMYITDLVTFKVIEVNNKGVELFGYKSKQDFLQNFVPTNHYLNPKERAENIQALRQNETHQLTREHEMIKVDGTRFWVKLFMKLYDDHRYMQLMAIDISETKRSQQELEAMVAERTFELTQSLNREKELNDMKSRFVSMASHEFRTPLTTISSSAFLVERDSTPETFEKGKKHLRKIRSSVNNLIGILDDFLSLEKIEHGKVILNHQNFDLKQMALGIVDEVKVILKPGQHINYVFEGAREIHQDVSAVKHILQNLLTNASKYSQEGTIRLTLAVQGGTVQLEVSDNGIGIPMEQQELVFSKFFRARNTHGIQGTGLGLNIVKNYVELLKGKISFASKPNEGTFFFVEFPTHFA
jgi:PAS domain S-box-containing protein